MQLEASVIEQTILKKLPEMVNVAVRGELDTLKAEVHRLSRESAGAVCHIQATASQAADRLVDAIVDFFALRQHVFCTRIMI